MSMLQIMLPEYIQAITKYLAINKKRYKFLIWIFRPEEYALCEAKRKSAEKLLAQLVNSMQNFEINSNNVLIYKNLESNMPPKRSLSATINTSLSPLDTPRPRAASIENEKSAYAAVLGTIQDSVATPLLLRFNYLTRRAMVSPNTGVLNNTSTHKHLVQLTRDDGLSLLNTSSDYLRINSSDNSASLGGKKHILNMYALLTEYVEDNSEPDDINNAEILLFGTVKDLITDEIEKICTLRQRADYSEHAEGSYDYLLQTILDNLHTTARIQEKLITSLEQVQANSPAIDPALVAYTNTLIFLICHFLCYAAFDKNYCLAARIAESKTNIYSFGTGFSVLNLAQYYQIKQNLEAVINCSCIIVDPKFQSVKILSDFQLSIDHLQTIHSIDSKYITGFKVQYNNLRQHILAQDKTFTSDSVIDQFINSYREKFSQQRFLIG